MVETIQQQHLPLSECVRISGQATGGRTVFTITDGDACTPITSGRRLPAFPGAEGFGRYAVGGRGGDVYHVTTLADDGPGSLRRGIMTATAPRTIVFDVGGTIVLQKQLRITNKANLTIAGRPPGKGITVRDWAIGIRDSHDIVIRYLRVRLGDQGKTKGGEDCMTVNRNQNLILDHLSLSWGVDGNWTIGPTAT